MVAIEVSAMQIWMRLAKAPLASLWRANTTREPYQSDGRLFGPHRRHHHQRRAARCCCRPLAPFSSNLGPRINQIHLAKLAGGQWKLLIGVTWRLEPAPSSAGQKTAHLQPISARFL